MSEKNNELQSLLDKVNSAYKDEYEHYTKQIDSFFTKDQSEIIKAILLAVYRLTILNDDSNNNQIHITAALDAFYELLVGDSSKIIDKDVFDSLASQRLELYYQNIQAAKEDVLNNLENS